MEEAEAQPDTSRLSPPRRWLTTPPTPLPRTMTRMSPSLARRQARPSPVPRGVGDNGHRLQSAALGVGAAGAVEREECGARTGVTDGCLLATAREWRRGEIWGEKITAEKKTSREFQIIFLLFLPSSSLEKVYVSGSSHTDATPVRARRRYATQTRLGPLRPCTRTLYRRIHLGLVASPTLLTVLDDVVERELVGGLREAPDELEHLAAVPPAAMAYAHDGEMFSDSATPSNVGRTGGARGGSPTAVAMAWPTLTRRSCSPCRPRPAATLAATRPPWRRSIFVCLNTCCQALHI
jgi:hypothetical protein